MAALSQLEFEEISRLLQQYFRAPLEARLQHTEDILKVVALRLENWFGTSSNLVQDRLRLRTELLSIATSQVPEENTGIVQNQEFSHYFGELQMKLDAFISQQEEVRHEIQKEERFLSQPDDTTLLRSAKGLKHKVRSLKNLQHTGFNWLRNALGSKEKDAGEWIHEIPWQGLLRQHLQITLLHRLQELLNISERQQAVILHAALELSSLPDRQPAPARIEVHQEIEQLLKRASNIRQQTTDLLRRQLDAILGRFYIELEEDYPRAGTIELPAAKLKAALIQKKKQRRQQQVETQLEEWKNTRLSLCNQWRLHLHLHNVTDQLHLQFERAQQQWYEGLHNQVFIALERLSNSLHGVKETLTVAPLPDAFTDSRQQLRQQVSQQDVAAAREVLLQQDLPGQLQALKGPVQQILANLPEQTIMGQPLKGQELVPVSQQGLTPVQVRELVSLEVLPMVINKLGKLREEAEQQIEEIRERLGEMEEVSLFNLDAAQAYWEQHPQDVQKARTIALEGLDRVLAHVTALHERLRQLYTLTAQGLQQLHGNISKSLFPLTLLENVKNLQIRLSRGKARRSHEALAQQNSSRLQALVPQLQQYLQETFSLRQSQTQLQQQAYEKTDPAAALADFLAKHEQAMLRLPFVYQRLYTLEPLTDELFLVGRTQELEALQNAYSRWTEGKFSSILISSEKGNGITTLLNIFINRLPTQQQVCRVRLPGYAASPHELAGVLAEALGLPPDSSLATVQQYLMQPEVSLVLVVEDLQLLFRRWVGGFDALKALLELISVTSKAVFWVGSCSVYSWQYLSRVTRASETWSSVLGLQALTQEQLSELILRRQRISGYQLQFEPGPEDLRSKHFSAMAADQQQAFLEQKYFRKLYNFCQGNLLLGLLYWLSSTLSVNKDSLVISTSLDPDFSFLKMMPEASYFYVHALLLHDQLTPPELAVMLGEGETTSRRQLQILAESGVLLYQRNEYRINPLLYRQLVDLLKNKNLLN